MTIISKIADMLDDHRRYYRLPVRIEIGAKQAEEIAEELGHLPLPREYTDEEVEDSLWLGMTLPKGPKLTAEKVLQGGQLFGVRLQGVESPDYLVVVAQERSS